MLPHNNLKAIKWQEPRVFEAFHGSKTSSKKLCLTLRHCWDYFFNKLYSQFFE